MQDEVVRLLALIPSLICEAKAKGRTYCWLDIALAPKSLKWTPQALRIRDQIIAELFYDFEMIEINTYRGPNISYLALSLKW